MEVHMTNRRDLLVLGMLSGTALFAQPRYTLAAEDCAAAAKSEAIGSALLDKYVAAVNAHETGPFPEIHTESYIQHSGRSPSGLAAQIENFRRIFASMPDIQMRVEDRVIAGDRIVARNTFSATHTQTIRGISPTGKAFTFRTIDIWRVENGKFAEHWDLVDIAEVLNKLRAG
jgi:predicted ester cyclase